MTGQPDSLAARRAELARRRAALTTEQQTQLSAAIGAAAAEHSTIPKRASDAPVPMSFAQELLWRLERASPGHVYNVPRAVRLAGVLDMPALQAALNALTARHEVLRTTFALVNDEPRQIIHDPAPVNIEFVDVSSGTLACREEAAREHMRNLARRPFDLEHDSQLRAAVIRLDAEDHVLQLLSHHVASDGWSGNIIMRDLSSYYEGFRSGNPVHLPELPVQYADFAVWQRHHLGGNRLQQLVEYWESKLGDAPALLDIPTDRPRTAALSFEGGSHSITLPAELAERLHDFSRSRGVTNFTVLLSTLYVLLARYSRGDEVVVGTPVAGRPHAELEGVVGFFANTLLLRTSLSGNPTFRELLDRVRAVTLGAFDNQDVPLETLLSTRGKNGRMVATVPQVVFSAEDPDSETLQMAHTATTRVGTALGATKFDFHMSVAARPHGLQLFAEYRTALFDNATVNRMLQHFGVLLDGVLRSPDAPVRNLPILTAQERAQVLLEWNDTQAEYPERATIHGLIEAQVQRRPDAVAVECTEGGTHTQLTYRELNARANRVAWALVNAGVSRDDRVALCLDRSVNTVVAILGVLKSGAAYLPIDLGYPDDRIQFTVQDASARIIITEAPHHTRLAELLPASKVVDLQEVLRDNDSAHDNAPTIAVAPGDMAYVIYTSGSTGRPKGVMVEHRNVTRLLVNNRSHFDFNEHDVWTVFHSFAFDFSVWELFGALVFGGRAVVVPRVVAQSPADFLSLLESTGTTVLNQVPSAFYGLMDQAVAKMPKLKVRYVIFGGEALKPALLRPWNLAWPDARLINMFGITETTVHVTYKEIGSAEIDAGVSNIGRPIPTLTCYVLDDQLQPVPVGVTGEICVGGLGVARGYLNRPELTAERFVADPFDRGEHLYRSGDLGRQLVTGEIEYLGRRDHQVKLRGHRIELGEIESALTQHSGVAEAAALVREDVPGDQRLVAYVVAAEIPAPTVGELREWVRKTLPEVMVPAAVVFLDHFPLTDNGKIDRKALPLPKGDTQQRSHVSPRTTIEHEIVQIWEQLLSPGRPISPFDDFFEIGGHSLLAIRMLAEVERVRGRRVPLAWLFESSTVEKLAARLGEEMLAENEPPLVVLQADGPGVAVAFVHGDWTGGGWYARRLAPLVAPDSPFYVLPTIGSEHDSTPWTIEAMAARHVSELRKVQPRGPYRVVGFCVGGVVAFEMARQMQAAGDRVDRLVLIDSSPANARFQFMAPLVRFLPATNATMKLRRQAKMLGHLRWADDRLGYFNRLPQGTKATWIKQKISRTLPRLIAQKFSRASTKPVPAPALASNTIANSVAAAPEVDRDALVLLAQSRAAQAYIPGHFAGQLEFVFASGAPGLAPRQSPAAQWRRLVDNVNVHLVPSGHISLITNNLPMLADALRAALNPSIGSD